MSGSAGPAGCVAKRPSDTPKPGSSESTSTRACGGGDSAFSKLPSPRPSHRRDATKQRLARVGCAWTAAGVPQPFSPEAGQNEGAQRRRTGCARSGSATGHSTGRGRKDRRKKRRVNGHRRSGRCGNSRATSIARHHKGRSPNRARCRDELQHIATRREAGEGDGSGFGLSIVAQHRRMHLASLRI